MFQLIIGQGYPTKMEVPSYLWAENYLGNLLGALLASPSPIPTHMLKDWGFLDNPDIWDQRISYRAMSTTPIITEPKDPHSYPH